MLKLEINEEFIKEFNNNIRRIVDVWYDLQGFKPYSKENYYKGHPIVEFPNYKCTSLKGYQIDKNYIRLKDGNIYWSCEILISHKYDDDIIALEESFIPQSWYYKTDDELREIFRPMLLKAIEIDKVCAEKSIRNYKEKLDDLISNVEHFKGVLRKLKL